MDEATQQAWTDDTAAGLGRVSTVALEEEVLQVFYQGMGKGPQAMPHFYPCDGNVLRRILIHSARGRRYSSRSSQCSLSSQGNLLRPMGKQ